MSPLSHYIADGTRILLSGCTPKDNAEIRSNFEREGFYIDTIPTLPDANNVHLSQYVLILMELPTEVTDGLHAIERIRQSGATASIPLLVFSPSNKTEILVEALNAGADDYLIRPFSIRELSARVRAVLRAARRG